MKTIREPKRQNLPWYSGNQYVCGKCETAVELEAGDDANPLVKIINEPRGETSAHAKCPHCRKWMKPVEGERLEPAPRQEATQEELAKTEAAPRKRVARKAARKAEK